MFNCVLGREEHCSKQIPLAYVGSAHSGRTTVGLPSSKVMCTSKIHTAQAPGCSSRALSQVGPVFQALSRSKLLRFSGVPQGHRWKWAMCFVPFPDLSSSDNQVLDECTVPGGPCILLTTLVLAAQFPRCTMTVHSQMCSVSPLESWSQAVTLLNILSLFLSFIFYPISFWIHWASFLGAWCPPTAFRRYFAKVVQHSNDLLMNLWGRKWSPHPIPPTSWNHLEK